MTGAQSLSHLSDLQLTERLSASYQRERVAVAEVVAHLGEVERRALHLDAGFSSLFEFCQKTLGMSESVAGTRVGLVRVTRRYPLILSMLASGQLHASGVRLLRPQLTPENHIELLEAAAGKSKRDIEKLLAQRFPRPDVETRIRKRPRRAPRLGAVSNRGLFDDASPDGRSHRETPSTRSPSTPEPPEPKKKNEVKPLSAERYGVSFTATAELVANNGAQAG